MPPSRLSALAGPWPAALLKYLFLPCVHFMLPHKLGPVLCRLELSPRIQKPSLDIQSSGIPNWETQAHCPRILFPWSQQQMQTLPYPKFNDISVPLALFRSHPMPHSQTVPPASGTPPLLGGDVGSLDARGAQLRVGGEGLQGLGLREPLPETCSWRLGEPRHPRAGRLRGQQGVAGVGFPFPPTAGCLCAGPTRR